MGYKNLSQCIKSLEARGELIRVDIELDPNQEIPAIQRRLYRSKAPAVLFTKVKGCNFPVVANLFGTQRRIHFIFRDTLEDIKRLFETKANGIGQLLRNPKMLFKLTSLLSHIYPKKVSKGPILDRKIKLSDLPQIKSWPLDGGAFITLPIVYSESPLKPGFSKSNMGMYRIQISGGKYQKDQEAGLHYQIHRGIGIHHQEALALNKPLKVNVFVGGPPALTLAAIMPLPHGVPEILFACLLAGHRIKMIHLDSMLPIPAEADFCIVGEVDRKILPEGPFGDHLGYYSLVHTFPVLKVKYVYARKDAIWPFTSVGRPPQEDTEFGKIIHELTAPLVPELVSGIKAVHAVDKAGVHPLLLAIGSERYVPYEEREPREIITQAMALLGQGQLSLAKYLFICAHEDNPSLDINDVQAFFIHVLERIDLSKDLHFITSTNTDTLDYTGGEFNKGSKLVLAAAGRKKRKLARDIPQSLKLPRGFSDPRVVFNGVLCIKAPPCKDYSACSDPNIINLCNKMEEIGEQLNGFPLIILVDDSEFCARNLSNFLWVTFTRSDPSKDIYAIGEIKNCKHWGARHAILIDARLKPHIPPVLEEDPKIKEKVESLAAPGQPLHGLY